MTIDDQSEKRIGALRLAATGAAVEAARAAATAGAIAAGTKDRNPIETYIRIAEGCVSIARDALAEADDFSIEAGRANLEIAAICDAIELCAAAAKASAGAARLFAFAHAKRRGL